MNEFIITTPEQLFEIVLRALKSVMPTEHIDKPQKIPDSCTPEQAIDFLAEYGYIVSKSKMYKLTAKKEIPFRYFGRRIVLSREELLEWVKSQVKPSSNESSVLLTLAEKDFFFYFYTYSKINNLYY